MSNFTPPKYGTKMRSQAFLLKEEQAYVLKRACWVSEQDGWCVQNLKVLQDGKCVQMPIPKNQTHLSARGAAQMLLAYDQVQSKAKLLQTVPPEIDQLGGEHVTHAMLTEGMAADDHKNIHQAVNGNILTAGTFKLDDLIKVQDPASALLPRQTDMVGSPKRREAITRLIGDQFPPDPETEEKWRAKFRLSKRLAGKGCVPYANSDPDDLRQIWLALQELSDFSNDKLGLVGYKTLKGITLTMLPYEGQARFKTYALTLCALMHRDFTDSQRIDFLKDLWGSAVEGRHSGNVFPYMQLMIDVVPDLIIPHLTPAALFPILDKADDNVEAAECLRTILDIHGQSGMLPDKTINEVAKDIVKKGQATCINLFSAYGIGRHQMMQAAKQYDRGTLLDALVKAVEPDADDPIFDIADLKQMQTPQSMAALLMQQQVQDHVSVEDMQALLENAIKEYMELPATVLLDKMPLSDDLRTQVLKGNFGNKCNKIAIESGFCEFLDWMKLNGTDPRHMPPKDGHSLLSYAAGWGSANTVLHVAKLGWVSDQKLHAMQTAFDKKRLPNLAALVRMSGDVDLHAMRGGQRVLSDDALGAILELRGKDQAVDFILSDQRLAPDNTPARDIHSPTVQAVISPN